MGHLTRDPIELGTLVAAVQSAERGAVVTFVGVVRDHQQGKLVVDLEYSAYEPMAESIATAVVTEATNRWPVRVGMVHRIGRLTIGEVAVAVATAAEHREEAFAACRYVIEQVKRRVPIWKRERYLDGSESWVDPTAPGVGHPVLDARGPS